MKATTEGNIINKRIKNQDMLKKFKAKKKYGRKSIARDIEYGMKEAREEARKQIRDKRVKKHNKRYL